MEPWGLLDIFVIQRAAELHQQRSKPVPPKTPGCWTVWRRRLARGLIGLGLRLDAEAFRAPGSNETAPQINGTDA